MAERDRTAPATLAAAARLTLPAAEVSAVGARELLPPSAAETADPVARALPLPPWEYDFYQALRRLECAFRDRPRWGAALRPGDEPLRLGQEATLSAAASSLARLEPAGEQSPARLLVHFFGMLGPNGGLPLHLTDYARQRLHHHGDPTFARFLDLFHHRMLALFYRAWASAQPAVQRDRPQSDRFASYVGSLFGLGTPALRERDAVPDRARLYYASLFLAHSRNASGLEALIGDYFQLPARIEQFVGEWLQLPPTQAWRLSRRGRPGATVMGRLGQSAVIGTRVWTRQHRFRVVLGPLRRKQFQALLPGGASLLRLRALVRSYAGDELKWDLKLVLEREALQPLELGRSALLGRTTWLVAQAGRGAWEDLVLDPMLETSPARPGQATAPGAARDGVANV
jgi:type VI secretion system protein ImpH